LQPDLRLGHTFVEARSQTMDVTLQGLDRQSFDIILSFVSQYGKAMYEIIR